ncbi:MAG: hypothetical protein K8U57_26910 [Planctomycetes bacterium]|nr:hypothetical protein [Planctomycetota bacterium]
MRWVLFLVLLACGCGKQPHPVVSPTAPAENGIRLPDAVSGKPIEQEAQSTIQLNINSSGEVIPPFEREADTDTLRNPARVEEYLVRRVDVEIMETGNEKPAAIPILRVDRDTPFEKSYPIMRACRVAGYEKYQLRVLHPKDSTETQIALTFPRTKDEFEVVPDVTAEQPATFIVRISTNDSGQIAELTFREDGSPDDSGGCLGAETAAYEKKLREIVDAEKQRIAIGEAKGVTIPQPRLTLEIADRLPQKTVVRLLDLALQAGFGDVWLVPVDSTKR